MIRVQHCILSTFPEFWGETHRAKAKLVGLNPYHFWGGFASVNLFLLIEQILKALNELEDKKVINYNPPLS